MRLTMQFYLLQLSWCELQFIFLKDVDPRSSVTLEVGEIILFKVQLFKVSN